MASEVKIENLQDLYDARKFRRSITVPKRIAWRGPIPTAWMMNLSGEILLHLFNAGMYLYIPKQARRAK